MADEFTSVVEGSIGAIPRRLMVPDDQVAQAIKLIADVDADG